MVAVKEKNKPVSSLAGGAFLLLSVFLTACDSGSDVDDLQSRVEVAANGYTLLQMSAVNSTIEVGQSLQLSLNALVDSESAETSVVNSAVWSVDNTDIATVDRGGMVTGIADGTVIVRARYGPLFSATNVQVSSADLVSIEISAAVEAISECDSVQLAASGTYNDGLAPRNLTDYVNWAVSGTTTVGAFNSSDTSGFLRSATAGQLSVTAGRNNVTVDPAFNLEVLDNLNFVEIPESAGTLTTSNDLQLSALATYNDGTTADITNNASWSVNDTAVATIGNSLPSKGLLDASQTGSVTVSAVCGGASGLLTVLAGDPTVAESVFFSRTSPFVVTFSQATTIQLKASVRLENQQEVEITEDADWSLVERGNSLNQLSNSTNSKGELNIRGTGRIRVRVEYTGDLYEDSTLNIPQLEIRVQ